MEEAVKIGKGNNGAKRNPPKKNSNPQPETQEKQEEQQGKDRKKWGGKENQEKN